VGATQINKEMQLACVRAIADLVFNTEKGLVAVETSEVLSAAYGGQQLHFGPGYIIPKPFDPRLITVIPPAVAKAAMETGVARRPLKDIEAYKESLRQYMSRSAHLMKAIFNYAKNDPRRIIYTEGEDRRILRAIEVLIDEGCARPILVGRPKVINNPVYTFVQMWILKSLTQRVMPTTILNWPKNITTSWVAKASGRRKRK
jgi:malate dehydrogenase (oxaloacetate-decarboxylating)(NADP+)